MELLRKLFGVADEAARQEYKNTIAWLQQMGPPLARLLNLVHFESLRSKLAKRAKKLIWLAAGAICGLGVFAWAANPPKSNLDSAVVSGAAYLPFDAPAAPGPVLKALYETCGGSQQLKLLGREYVVPGWLDVMVESPESCKGLRIVVPSQIKPFVAAPISNSAPANLTPTPPVSIPSNSKAPRK